MYQRKCSLKFMTQGFARITHSFVKSAFCLLLAFGCLLGFSGNAFAASDIDGSWVLNGRPTPVSLQVVAIFDNGKLFGRGYCNQYSASYKTFVPNKIRIVNFSSTKLPCDVSESQYFDALQTAQFYEVSGVSLSIFNRTPNSPLSFRR